MDPVQGVIILGTHRSSLCIHHQLQCLQLLHAYLCTRTNIGTVVNMQQRTTPCFVVRSQIMRLRWVMQTAAPELSRW
jgi:hypothetical protein